MRYEPQHMNGFGRQPARLPTVGASLYVALLRLATVAFVCGARVICRAAEDPGRAVYLKYCGACHGPDGRGDGLVAPLMQPQPTDLTTIARRNGGTFPYLWVLQTIDGTKQPRAHGDPDMPVWGDVLRETARMGAEGRSDVQGRLMRITDYIKSIQVR